MEKFPSSGDEKAVRKTTVVEVLRSKGINDPEARKLVEQWTIEQEEKAAAEGTVQASIMFNVDRADLYLAQGDKDGAWTSLEDARMQAYQENEDRLYELIMKKMDELDASY